MSDDSFLVQLLNPNTLNGAIFYAVLFIVVAFIVSRIVRFLIARYSNRKKRPVIDKITATFISQLLQVIIFFAAAIIYFYFVPSLRTIGTAILATAGVTSIVLGLAAQNTLGNIISGISLLVYRPVRLGDKIKVYASAGDETGVVDSITLGYTTLIMPNNERIIVPNSVLASTVIVNYGRNETTNHNSA
jgi:small-conductance mechanosensitive channel